MSLKDISKLLEAAQTDLIFTPTPDMRRVKAAFWTKVSDKMTLVDTSNITLTAAQQVEKDRRLAKWWSLPGFSEWFQNREEFRERLEYLADIALDTLEQVLVDPAANTSAKVSCAKLVLEAASKMPRKENESNPSKLESMSRIELEDYVRRNLKYLSPPETSIESLTESEPSATVEKANT